MMGLIVVDSNGSPVSFYIEDARFIYPDGTVVVRTNPLSDETVYFDQIEGKFRAPNSNYI